MSAKTSATVTGNQVAGVLQDYLDQLLVGATEGASEAPKVIPEALAVKPIQTSIANSVGVTSSSLAQPQNTISIETLTPERAWASEALAGPMLASVMTARAVESLVDTPEVQDWDEIGIEANTLDEAELEPQKSEIVTLNWASSQGIECLIFKVAGLKLAIPLPLLGGVFNVNDKVTPLFGQAKWSLGIWQSDEQKLTVVDSAQLIMLERGKSQVDEGYNYLIQLDRAPWALACQEITDTVTLVEQSIKWRGEGSKRPWLAGTVIAEMCALIDVPGLLSLLEENRR